MPPPLLTPTTTPHTSGQQEGNHPPPPHHPLASHGPHLCINGASSVMPNPPPPHLLPRANGVWGKQFQYCRAATECMAPFLQMGSPTDKEGGNLEGGWGGTCRGMQPERWHTGHTTGEGGTQGTQPEGGHTGHVTEWGHTGCVTRGGAQGGQNQRGSAHRRQTQACLPGWV